MAMNNRLLRPRASGFNPKQIANLGLWLDADDASTITTVSGGVSEWRDKSGSGRVFSQEIANNRPTVATNVFGTKPAIRFDGSNDALQSTADAGSLVFPATLFMVVNKPVSTSDGGLFTHIKSGTDSYNSADAWVLSTNTNAAAIRVLGGVNTNLFPGVGSSGTLLGKFLVSLRIATNSAILKNRTAGLSNTDALFTLNATPSNNGCGLGFLSTWTGAANSLIHNLAGDIAEVLIYSRALSASEESSVENYLAKKYGLTLL